MKTQATSSDAAGSQAQDAEMVEIVQKIVRAVQSVQYGSVEVVIQNSKVVQIERKEKFRFDKPARL